MLTAIRRNVRYQYRTSQCSDSLVITLFIRSPFASVDLKSSSGAKIRDNTDHGSRSLNQMHSRSVSATLSSLHETRSPMPLGPRFAEIVSGSLTWTNLAKLGVVRCLSVVWVPNPTPHTTCSFVFPSRYFRPPPPHVEPKVPGPNQSPPTFDLQVATVRSFYHQARLLRPLSTTCYFAPPRLHARIE